VTRIILEFVPPYRDDILRIKEQRKYRPEAYFMFQHIDLKGSRIIITGASSGIGWELAQRLAEKGARLLLASRNSERLQTLETTIRQGGGEAYTCPMDVTQSEDRSRMIEAAHSRLGGLDMLINNAGVGAMGFFADAARERLGRIFDVNFFGVTELTRLALPLLVQGKNPMVVNVGSILGRRGIPGCTEYCASKFALSGWSEGLRAELAQSGVHVLLANPGSTRTSFRDNLIENQLSFGWQGGGMTADRCARIIVRAMEQRRNEVIMTAQGKMLIWLNRLLPRVVDGITRRVARQASRVPSRPDTPVRHD
jgi:short-subunit dehydrogenase